ncbi:S-layer glycoprotein N-glycosyltransferase AglJ [Halomarina oriensis]|uniref:S-layer glycoprotein N-glycosyltransferase AglJ n=1 Tax=Halomarina oriensis TaxID=671145 RepID=A0A6B0GM30_9EURY|nr:S-layer glycoprotein N-glycosyltransferase AglJ [Halomarina oriensis]MWG35710.1 S-layer glycoprotein N-glycosyltransferase AglJ [Halomarina oriensis]
MTNTDVCVLVPTLDEAETIGPVIDGFVEQGFENVLVVDGGSTDGTRDLARERGARVIEQSGEGKGQAVREAFDYVDVPYVLMLDGDMTYDPADAPKMLEPLFEGRADHVIGDRFADMHDGAMPRLNQFGNRVINSAFATIHGRNLGDILSGYRAFTLDSIRRIELESDGFTIETELAVECVKHGVRTAVVPVSYHPRPDDSDTNLHPVKDGGRIIFALYSLAKLNNPLFYFGSVGVISALVGVGIGAWVGYEWWVVGISHQVYAVVAGVAILLGAQLLMFAVLSDMIVAVNREQTHRLEAVADRLQDDRTRGQPTARSYDALDETEERELRAED